ncbi:hypothetical protein BGW80DRAFT_1311504 [Lactifluus volemus]|nr:hypothetical protein BGW80DRAFT_1311504 [Lactifluus volemus]
MTSLLWSIISAMTAMWPAWGPALRSTTVHVQVVGTGNESSHNLPRPTFTKRAKFDSNWDEQCQMGPTLLESPAAEIVKPVVVHPTP